ncbi:transposase [Streptomyces sp. NPDC051658]|uniref:transposase n=1 Tax=Streptomyces sp. NPDC051658 TaxID=3365667 RepID=UPI00379E7917
MGALPDKLWHPALDQNGTLRNGAEVAELTGILPPFRDQRRLARAVPGAIDLLAWTRVLLLDGELAAAEPKKLRYRILHVAARLTHGGRRLRLRICSAWPWKHELATAFHRLAALPRPAG